MKNILSYKLGTIFKGYEIKWWINQHLICPDRLKRKMAKKMERYLFTLKDECDYYLSKDDSWWTSTYKSYLVNSIK